MPKTRLSKKRGRNLKKKIDPPKRGEVLLFWNFVQQVFKNTNREEACADSEGQQTSSAPPAKPPILRRSINLRSRRVRL